MKWIKKAALSEQDIDAMIASLTDIKVAASGVYSKLTGLGGVEIGLARQFVSDASVKLDGLIQKLQAQKVPVQLELPLDSNKPQ